jgi:hypothetical protein
LCSNVFLSAHQRKSPIILSQALSQTSAPGMQLRMAVLLLAMVAVRTAAMMHGSRPAERKVPAKSLVNISTGNVSAAEVAKLHRKMETIAAALEGMLSAKQRGSLADAKVAPTLRSFLTELRAVLSATSSPTDLPVAMRRLRSAQDGMVDLTKALNSQQEALMKEDATEETNLLLGVLMTQRAEPMEKQLEVLKSPDFVRLQVCKALLTNHDGKTPLVQQVAVYMDTHGMSSNATSADEKARKLEKTVAYFEQRVEAMGHEDQVLQRLHERRMFQLDSLMKKSDQASAHRLQLEKNHMDREYRKRRAVQRQQSKVMKDIVSALKKGDSKALKKAQDALKQHLAAMQARTGNFLHLLQLGHRLARRDCPFCVAQCIGKCHDGGSPYAQCMTQCADAGQ